MGCFLFCWNSLNKHVPSKKKNVFFQSLFVAKFFALSQKVRPKKMLRCFHLRFLGFQKTRTKAVKTNGWSTCHTNDLRKQNPSKPKPWQLSQCEASHLPRKRKKFWEYVLFVWGMKNYSVIQGWFHKPQGSYHEPIISWNVMSGFCPHEMGPIWRESNNRNP